MDFNKLIQSIAWNLVSLAHSDSGQQQGVFHFNIWSEGATSILGPYEMCHNFGSLF